ncbi:site-2 protease family protein [Umezakia ovalisporum]|jgi:Zn-dependent protease|uniref:Zinc metalloprotease n=2 Tax=Umezakia ovalisporum TaxID=75695 RepID=A0AA43GZD2_9CYAN|nr:site-2 protease family protein [Umezakia ovalisporum]MDH6057413.1 site-2 protease family protein [Umezakia ovalisporum FSS-43]MDH6064210.1 site-2 protease family protein [Umezakia ovalisporum FSS-62]MDH6070803.1 site-2 protease family protein [Umezakia ovalisporum CobakiLakeA]MDH6074921.1 site-2 protease family protein [Umezakia ovalisporum CS-1034]MDH6077964.1 site-2 protease family protein [Umezakia ovalisporum FSS-45]
MQTSWRIGSLFGIPLLLDPLWFIILALATLNFGIAYQEWGTATAWSAGIVMALLLFASVLLHELGHSLAARWQGIRVNSITLFMFGGIAAIEEESKTPGKAFQVAIAGPLVSIALFLLLSLATNITPETSPFRAMVTDLARINLVVALFNLIPGLPLDGGQVLKAALWQITGNRFEAVHWAARAGQILGYSAIALGLAVDFLTTELVAGLWIALLGWFAVRNANSYHRLTTLQETLLKIIASDAMTRDFRVVDADQTLRAFADSYLLDSSAPNIYFAVSDGRYRGMVAIDDLRLVERSEWENRTLQSILHPLTEIPTVAESTSMAEVINKLENQQLPRITVLSPAGTVAGVIDRGDIVRELADKLKLRITHEEIKLIKQKDSYPPGLQLGAIAKSATN